MATVEEDGALEDDGMSDSGYLESQANNMDQITVRLALYLIFVKLSLMF